MRRELDPDTIIRHLAHEQHGVVGRRQLIAEGVNPGAVDRRRRAGRLIPLHRGVFAVGHVRLRREGWWLAAVLACGEGAALSHFAAAALWGMLPPRERIDVTTPARGGRAKRHGIVLHRVRSLPDDEVVVLHGIRVTTVARTLLDLAALLDAHELEQAIHHADRSHRYDGRAVRAVLAVHPTRPGAPRLTALLDRLEGVGAQATRSRLEVAFLRLCDGHSLPRPVANARVHGFEVDFHWPGTNLVVETDGSHHRMPEQRERDHEKRLALEAAGLRVVTLTYRQVKRSPAQVATALRTLLHS